jgi:hypothetical protein
MSWQASAMRTALIPLILSSLAIAAKAQEITSAYTDLDLDRCEKIDEAREGEGEWTQWRCKGYDGIEVRVSEDDLRFSVSLGPNAENQCAARQTFNKFNSLGPRIEWRIAAGKPFATILRWYQSADGEKTNWLVISKYDGRQSCQVAYVDPALPDANAVARRKADEKAQGFDCAKDKPEIVSGKTMKLGDLVNGVPCTAE